MALRFGAQTPAVVHSAHAGFASAAAIAALLLPDAPVHCDAPPRGGWYAGVPEPFPTAAFRGEGMDRSFILDKQLRPSGTVVSSIADGPRGISYVKASTVSAGSVLGCAMVTQALHQSQPHRLTVLWCADIPFGVQGRPEHLLPLQCRHLGSSQVRSCHGCVAGLCCCCANMACAWQRQTVERRLKPVLARAASPSTRGLSLKATWSRSTSWRRKRSRGCAPMAVRAAMVLSRSARSQRPLCVVSRMKMHDRIGRILASGQHVILALYAGCCVSLHVIPALFCAG